MKFILSIFFFLPFLCLSQVAKNEIYPLDIPEFEVNSGEIIYREIFEFQADQKKLHSIGLKTISELYRSSKSVIDLNDLENGILVVKGNLPLQANGYYVPMGNYLPLKVTYTLEHVLMIESKDSRIRVTLDKFKFISAVTSDGQITTFNQPNNLDEQYIKNYKNLILNEKAKKRENANFYNMSVILNELNQISLILLDQIQENYTKNLKDDW
ncbi:hypothetical protein [Algoriphagus sp.]|jgi:hypothetical protein|uniref:hypothetical protein n=1 Tax=Algoriphagus sp. TaxID=1872435 RepID=UPI00271F60CA|nr:hypothetical protein [Algoriphagus sp.]MDO8965115.1 hypothetical protein [Algoriphagus sp.]MDP3199189.1 hypothetical protein [Algoriphagus sp.]